MPTAWTLAQIQAKTAGDLAYVDGVQTVSFQQVTDGTVTRTVTSINGFLETERWQTVDGLEVICRDICLQANQMSAITRVTETDQVVDEAGAVWVLRSAELIIWDTQWKGIGIRLDCLITIQGTTVNLEQTNASADAAAGIKPAWTLIGINIPVRIQVIASEVREEFKKKYMLTHYVFYTRQSGICVGQRFAQVNGAATIYYRITDVTEFVQKNPLFPTWYAVGCERKQDLEG